MDQAIYQVRQQLRDEKKELRAFGSILAKRDLSPEEAKRFDVLTETVSKLCERLDRMELVEDEEGGVDEEQSAHTTPSRSLRQLPAGMGSYSSYTSGGGRFGIHSGGDHNEYRIGRAIRSLAEGRPVVGLERGRSAPS